MKNKNFLEQLIIKIDPSLDDTGIDMFVADAEPVLQEWIFTKIISVLNESQRIELSKLTEMNKGISGKVYTYLSKTIPHYELFIQNAYQEFEKKYQEEINHFAKHEE